MKVSELMEALERLDPDHRVGVEVADGDDLCLVEVESVFCDLRNPRVRVGLQCRETPGYHRPS